MTPESMPDINLSKVLEASGNGKTRISYVDLVAENPEHMLDPLVKAAALDELNGHLEKIYTESGVHPDDIAKIEDRLKKSPRRVIQGACKTLYQLKNSPQEVK